MRPLDLSILGLFNKNAERIWKARAAQNLSWTLRVTMKPGSVEDSSTLHDDELMRSLATSMRQMLSTDPASYPNVRKHVSEHLTTAEGRALLKRDSKFWGETLSRKTPLQIGTETWTGDRILKVWFNGEVFHTDAVLAADYALVQDHPLLLGMFEGQIQSCFYELMHPIGNLYAFTKYMFDNGGAEPLSLSHQLADGTAGVLDLRTGQFVAADR